MKGRGGAATWSEFSELPDHAGCVLGLVGLWTSNSSLPWEGLGHENTPKGIMSCQ